MAVATWQDVAGALGKPTSAFTAEQQTQIEHWLTGVELLIRNRLGPVAALDQETVLYVEAEAVAVKARPLLEEGGAESVTVSVDDGSVTRRFKQRAVSASDITDEWWELLAPNVTSAAFTINPYPARRRGCW